MAQDIIITPGDGDIVFHNTAGTEAGKIYLNGDDLVITNAVGNVLFGDTSSDVYIGDGINSVDIVFEQNGEIRAETGADVTLTIGSSTTTLKLAGLSNQSSEATSLMIDANNVVGYRELGSAAFSATTAFAAASHNHDSRYYTETEIDTLLTGYASTSTATTSKNGLMSSTDKSKLDGIASGAEVNVQADWNATTGDALILNKPTLGTASSSASTDFVSVSGDTMTGALRLPWMWNSTDLTANSFYVKRNDTEDGFAFGIGTGVSTWFSWDTEVGTKRAIDVWNDGSLILLGAGGANTEIENTLYVPSQIIHTDDTDTYMQFHAGDQWRVVTGGTERLEVNNTATTVQNTLTASGGINGLTLANGGISGSNFNITGVNQLEISDPGEGIVFKSGSSGDMTLAIVDDTNDNILRFSGTNAQLQVGTNRVLTTADEGTGNGLDADTLDGNHATAFAAASHNHDSRYYTETEVDTFLTAKASTDVATSSKNGLMSSTDKSKLDGIDANANNYVLPTNIITAGTYGSTSNSTKIDNITVDSSGRVTAITTGGTGDINGVTAGTNLSGGGTSGTVTLNLNEFLDNTYTYQNTSTGVFMPMVKGGLFTTQTSSVTGALRIDLPSYRTDMMLSFTVDIYEYDTDRSATYRVGGYNYSDANATWYNTFAYCLQDSDNRDLTVYFMSDTTNGKQYVKIGSTSTTWSYPQVVIRDALGGYATSLADFVDTWGVSFVTETPGTATSTHQDNQVYTAWNRISGIPSTFSPSAHTHDDRYYTETETDTLLSGKSDTSHNHDSRYYTETEVDTLLGGYATTSTATSTKNGLMSSTDKSKLDGVAANANNYSLPVAGASLGGVKSGTDISIDGSGNVSVNNDSHTHDTRYYTETEVSATLGNGIAGWTAGYGSGTYANVRWSVANDAVEIQSSSDTSIGGVFKAIRVKAGDVVRFSVMLKGSAASSNGLYLRLYQYNGDLPNGKTHVSNDAQGSLVQEDSAGDTGWYENGAITTSWTNFERDYTAAADGYVSLVVLNWTGIGNNSVFVKTPDIQKVKMASAGTADSANAVSWDNVSSKPTSFTPSAHTHDYLPLAGGTMTGAFSLKSDAWHTSTDSKNRLYFGNNARTYFGSANGYEWRNSSDGALAVLLNTGLLGIGTTSPAYSIDVSGGAIAIRGNAAGNSLRFNDSGGTSRNAIYVDTSNYLNVGNANYTGLKLFHSTTTAPQTNALDGGGISQGFGNTDNGTVLAEPAAWLEVRVGTTDYVIPMYLNG
jgi:hypothetical protein